MLCKPIPFLISCNVLMLMYLLALLHVLDAVVLLYFYCSVALKNILSIFFLHPKRLGMCMKLLSA